MIIKIGGSVAKELDSLGSEIHNLSKCLIVPGGWIFADKVRVIDRMEPLNPSASHWMAILSMNIYGYYLADILDIELLEPSKLEDLKNLSGVKVVLPYIILKKYDELPHTWDVTSDSISIWLASKVGETEVIKLTASGGIIEDGQIVNSVKASEVASDVIDSYAPYLMQKYRINMFICGTQELKNYIRHKEARGTLIKWR